MEFALGLVSSLVVVLLIVIVASGVAMWIKLSIIHDNIEVIAENQARVSQTLFNFLSSAGGYLGPNPDPNGGERRPEPRRTHEIPVKERGDNVVPFPDRTS